MLVLRQSAQPLADSLAGTERLASESLEGFVHAGNLTGINARLDADVKLNGLDFILVLVGQRSFALHQSLDSLQLTVHDDA